jgi:hypothetical protein
MCMCTTLQPTWDSIDGIQLPLPQIIGLSATLPNMDEVTALILLTNN